MRTLNLRKVFHLVEPDQPVHIWLVGVVTDLFNNPIWCASTIYKTSAKNVKLVNRHLPKWCDLEHPIVFVRIIGSKYDHLLLANEKTEDALKSIKELPKEQFFKEFEENTQLVSSQINTFSDTMKIVRDSLDSIQSTLSKLS